MPSMRVNQLAKEYGLSSKEMLDKLRELKIPAKSHASVLAEPYVDKVYKALGEPSAEESAEEVVERPLTKDEQEAKERWSKDRCA